MRRRKYRWALVLAAASLAGCTSVEALRPDIAAKPLPSRLDEIAYINSLRSAYEVVTDDHCFDGKDLRAFKAKLGQGYRKTDDPENFLSSDKCLKFKAVDGSKLAGKSALADYLTAGFGLTDLYCKRFFSIASETQQNRVFGRNLTNGVDTLVGSILTLASAGDTAIGITNGSFGLINGTLEGFDAAYLVGPDMPEVERLVKAEQTLFKETVFAKDGKSFPSSYAGARSVIESYAGICSFTGMRQLVAKSVADKTETLNQKVQETRNDTGQGQNGQAGQGQAGQSVIDRIESGRLPQATMVPVG